MSREIRFRVWKKSINDFLIGTFTPYNGVWNTNSEDDLIWEQYTLLNDKDGREIYEGDIVRWSHGREDIGVVTYCKGNPFVGYPNACFYGVEVIRLSECCIFQQDDEYEVIGNIHQNSDLLT